MGKRKRVYRAFTLIEVLTVLGILIIITAVGINGFLTIRETFIAKENVELIIQDIKSAKLKAMNMSKGEESNWIYGFGIDFRDFMDNEDYHFFKWCAPVSEFGELYSHNETDYDLTKGVIPSFYTGFELSALVNPTPPNLCNVEQYWNGNISASCYNQECEAGKTGIVQLEGISTSLIDRSSLEVSILSNILGQTFSPAILFFESLTGRAILYASDQRVLNYMQEDEGLSYNSDNFYPIDIVIKRKRSNKFDLISVYPLSGEVIHHVYDSSDYPQPGVCEESSLACFTFGGKQYKRFGIEDEINSYRD